MRTSRACADSVDAVQTLLGHVVEGYYNTTGVTEAFATADPVAGVPLPTLAGTELLATMVRYHRPSRTQVVLNQHRLAQSFVAVSC